MRGKQTWSTSLNSLKAYRKRSVRNAVEKSMRKPIATVIFVMNAIIQLDKKDKIFVIQQSL